MEDVKQRINKKIDELKNDLVRSTQEVVRAKDRPMP